MRLFLLLLLCTALPAFRSCKLLSSLLLLAMKALLPSEYGGGGCEFLVWGGGCFCFKIIVVSYEGGSTLPLIVLVVPVLAAGYGILFPPPAPPPDPPPPPAPLSDGTICGCGDRALTTAFLLSFCFCSREVAYDGGGGAGLGLDGCIGVTHVTLPVVGAEGATAVWRTGFWTWVDFTECIMIGCCVLVWRAPLAGGKAIGLAVELLQMAFCDTVIGEGEPAEALE